ncbi:hypothetical protein SCLARK_00511 [Spiroplasma clarkii]|uniref:hypothetical protein n=1 Tax=Spiroplasma clarkii TaxID=2139 RepID=UPI000B55E93E|nr:hypothetical protein [Spiroplasma clarkii]ARU91205.1 hypothetical protein SCLARK_00511 [Spiroplasma clarkii]
MKFYIDADFAYINSDGDELPIDRETNLRIGSFAHHNAIINPVTIENSIFTNEFQLNYTFVPSIEHTDSEQEFPGIIVKSDIGSFYGHQIIDMLNGVDLGPDFKTHIVNYIEDKLGFKILASSITFGAMHKATLVDGKYHVGDNIPLSGEMINETNNNPFYVGITSTDADGTFNILFRFERAMS